MLTEIYIRNYLFVPEQRLRFGPGMTVLSGETGAGKSILVGSIALIFGEASAQVEAFDPEQPVYLEASFIISANPEVQSYLQQQGYHIPEELCLAREINPGGRSTYFLEGRKVSAALLKELKPLIIDFHHQREQQRLLSPSYQLELLDVYAQNAALKADFAGLYKKLRRELAELDELKEQAARNQQLSELYHYQFHELQQANLKAEEDRQLQQEFELLSHAREINETALNLAHDLFERDNSLHDQLSRARAALGRWAHINEQLAEIERGFSECQEIIAESAAGLAGIADSTTADPHRLEELQARLDTINELLYKHRVNSVGELLALFAERGAQIAAFADHSERIQALEQTIAGDFELLKTAADQLSLSRQAAAAKLCRELKQNISQLAIPDAQFEIRIDKKADSKNLMLDYLAACSESGTDVCQYCFSANRGRELKSLSAVASGGELSRILLAIKKVLSERIEEKLIILDEIDAGIGGKTAEQVAQFIFRLAQRHRILCITHLAQIAAIAHQQIALSKRTVKDKTLISMNLLDKQERLCELARMLSGNVSEISLKHADELISKYNM